MLLTFLLPYLIGKNEMLIAYHRKMCLSFCLLHFAHTLSPLSSLSRTALSMLFIYILLPKSGGTHTGVGWDRNRAGQFLPAARTASYLPLSCLPASSLPLPHLSHFKPLSACLGWVLCPLWTSHYLPPSPPPAAHMPVPIVLHA